MLQAGVSIIIPTYKADPYLFDAIESVYKQRLDHSEFEILVIDDKYPAGDLAAKEKHEKILAELKTRIAADPEKYSNLKILNSGENGLNNGQAAARNVGIRAAQFPFIAGLDADDMYAFNAKLLDRKGSFLQRGIDALANNPGVALVDCEIYQFGPGKLYVEDRPAGTSDIIHTRQIQSLCMSNKAMFRKDDALAPGVNGYDESLRSGEDSHFFPKLLAGRVQKGLPIQLTILPQAYYLYRQHPQGVENVSRRQMDFKEYATRVIRDALPYFQKYHGDKSPEEIYEIVQSKREVLIRTGTERRERLERIEDGTASRKDKLLHSLVLLKADFDMCRATPDSREYAAQKFLHFADEHVFARFGFRLGLDKPIDLIHPDLKEMGIEPSA